MALSVGEIEATLRLKDEMSSQLKMTSAEVKKFAETSEWGAEQVGISWSKAATVVNREATQMQQAMSKFSGTETIAQAERYAQAVEQVGGVSALTRKEQAELNGVMTEAVAKYRALGQEAPEDMQKLAAATENAVTATRAFDTQLRNISMGMTHAGILMSAAVTAPIVGAGVAAIKFGTEFETELTKVQTLAGAGSKEIENLRSKVMDLAPAVGIGAGELTKALFPIESEGYRGAQAMEILETAAKGVAIGMGDTFTVARTLVTTMKAFQQQGLSAADAMDILVATVQQGDIPIDALVGSLGRVTPIAAALGISFDQVGAAIATFTRVGVSADLAVTGLRAVLVGLEMPTSKAGKAIAEMYGSVENLRKVIAEKGLAQALVEMIEKTHGNVEALRELFPNVRAMTEALSNAKSQGEDYIKVQGRIKDSHGILQESFKETEKTLAQKWKELTAAAENLAIHLSDGLMPIVKQLLPYFDDAVKAVGSVVNMFVGLPQPVQMAVAAFAAMLAAIGPLLLILGQVGMAAGGLVTAFGVTGIASAATAAGTAITAVFVPALLAIAVPAALYEVYQLLKNIGGLMGDMQGWQHDAEGVAATFRNELAAASKIAGHEITNLAEAHAILQKRIADLRSETGPYKNAMDGATITVKGFITDLRNHEKALTDQERGLAAAAKRAQEYADDMGKLGAAGRASVIAQNAHHVSLEQLAKDFNVNVESLQRLVAEQHKADQSVKESAANWKKIHDEEARDHAHFVKTVQDGLLKLELLNDKETKKIADDWTKAFLEIHKIEHGIEGLKINIGEIGFKSKEKDLFTELFGDKDTFTRKVADIVKGIPQLLQQALAGGGGFVGFGEALLSQFGALFGGEAMSGRFGALVSKGLSKLFGKSVGTMLGVMLPGIGEAIGSMLGPLIAKIGELFHKPEWKKVMKDVGQDWGTTISEELAKQIADTEKKFHVSRNIAEMLNLSKILDEAGGLTAQNFQKFSDQALGLIGVIKAGGAAGKQALAELDSYFGKVVDHMNTSMGGLADKTMLLFIGKIRLAGVELKGLTDYLNAQVTKIDAGFNAVATAFAAPFMKAIAISEDTSGSFDKLYEKQQTLIATIVDLEKKTSLTARQENQLRKAREDLATVTYYLSVRTSNWAKAQEDLAKTLPALQGGFDRMGRLAAASFNAALASGKSFMEALEGLGSGLDDLIKLQETFGLTSSGTFNELVQFRQFIADNKELANSIDGLNQLMIGLNNAGVLTQETFADLGATALDTFNRMLDGGLNSDQAMRLMQPTLQTLWKLEKEFGFTVDNATQALLDQAEKQGIVGEKMKTVNEQILDVLKAIAKVLGATIPGALDDMATASEHAAGRMGRALGGISFPHLGDGGGAPPGFASGTRGYQYFGAGTLAMLHGWEKVEPIGRAGSGGGLSNGQPVIVPVTLYMGEEVVAEVVARTTLAHGRQ